MKVTEYKIINGYKVESGIPMPKQNRVRGASKYPFSAMGLNESVFFPMKKGERKERVKISVAARKACIKNDMKFATRSVAEDVDGKETEGLRVWRIK